MIWFRLGGLDLYPVTHGKPRRAILRSSSLLFLLEIKRPYDNT